MSYRNYVIETAAYGIVGMIGVVGLVYYIILNNIVLAFLAFIFTYIAFDNFFCGSRLSKHSGKACKQHYIIPPFLKGNKK